jgi:lipooligosaccharide transport system permease protein
VANSLPAFIEPILFLAAIGLGLGTYVEQGIGGLPMAAFMGPGALAMTAMYGSVFESTYGTFVRLIYQKTYDGMLATPLTPGDVFLGEAIWCGLKALAFTAVVLSVYLAFGYANGWLDRIAWSTCWLTPLVGLCCGLLFAGLGFHVTAITQNLNNFNFFISGALVPMSLFSGMMFPVADLPRGLRELAYALPLFHVTELNRLLLLGPERCDPLVRLSPLYLVVASAVLLVTGIRAMSRRIVQ